MNVKKKHMNSRNTTCSLMQGLVLGVLLLGVMAGCSSRQVVCPTKKTVVGKWRGVPQFTCIDDLKLGRIVTILAFKGDGTFTAINLPVGTFSTEFWGGAGTWRIIQTQKDALIELTMVHNGRQTNAQLEQAIHGKEPVLIYGWGDPDTSQQVEFKQMQKP